MSRATRPSHPLTVILIAALVYAIFMTTRDSLNMQSADLFATWVAGEFMTMGRLDDIYPASPTLFDMTPPAAWWDHVPDMEANEWLFPYIYPPIWAKLVSWITPYTSFHTFDLTFLMAHQAMLVATLLLAAKLCHLRGQTAFVFATVSYVAFALTLPIGAALGQNQPQVLVTFLIVYGFERAASGHPRTAGGLLALAASIKGYPLLFIVIFAARKDWPTVLSFASVGAALAAGSIALAGWPLHADYLRLLAVLSKSVIVTNFSLTADAFTAGAFFPDRMISTSQIGDTTQALRWSAIAKGPVWTAVSTAAQLTAVAGVGVLAAHRPNDPLLLPFSATLFAFLSPLSWAYTYLTAYVFIGILPLRFGVWGWGVALVGLATFHPRLAVVTIDIPLFGGSVFLAGGIAFTVILLVALLVAVLRNDKETAPP